MRSAFAPWVCSRFRSITGSSMARTQTDSSRICGRLCRSFPRRCSEAMSRALSVARVQVSPANEPEYLALLAELARRVRSRRPSLWLFRRPEQRDTFIEISESATREQHRSQAQRDEREQALEARLQVVATYAPDADDLWEAVSLG